MLASRFLSSRFDRVSESQKLSSVMISLASRNFNADMIKSIVDLSRAEIRIVDDLLDLNEHDIDAIRCDYDKALMSIGSSDATSVAREISRNGDATHLVMGVWILRDYAYADPYIALLVLTSDSDDGLMELISDFVRASVGDDDNYNTFITRIITTRGYPWAFNSSYHEFVQLVTRGILVAGGDGTFKLVL